MEVFGQNTVHYFGTNMPNLNENQHLSMTSSSVIIELENDAQNTLGFDLEA